MGCDIVFKIKGNLRRGLLDQQLSDRITIQNSSLLSDSELTGLNDSLKKLREVSLANIVRELLQSKNAEEKAALVQVIKGLQSTSSRAIKAADIETEGIVGNSKYHTLKFKYPEITFPDLQTPYDPDILLVDELANSGFNFSDTIHGTDTNGNLVYVVTDSEAGVKRLAAHLRVRDLILNQYENNAELAELMPEIAKVKGKEFSSQKDLLLDFITHNSEYQNVLTDKGLFGLLNEIVANLNNSDRAGYKNPLDRDFTSKLTKVRRTKSDYLLSKKDFINLIKIYQPELLQDLSSEQLKSEEVLAQLFEKFYPNLQDVAAQLKGFVDRSLIIRTLPRTLENTYGMTYSTIAEQTKLEDTYRGFNIYSLTRNGKVSYLFSQDVLTPKTIAAKLYNTVGEVQEVIDSNYNYKETFSTRFETGFRMIPAYERVNAVYTTRWHEPGSVVKVLNLELDRNTILDPEESALFKGNALLSDFYRVFQKQLSAEQFQALQNVVKSIETAGIFTYLVNERIGHTQSLRNFERDSGKFEQILQDINDALTNNAYKYYFIQDCSGSKGNFFVKMIPVKGDVQMNEKYSRPEPIIGIMNEVIDEFNRQFKIGATLLTQDEINSQFPDVPAGTKAFVRNGNIYINGSLATSEDVIHEYTHLFLGALKAQNYDMYVKLLERVMKSNDDWVGKVLTRIENRYPNLARQDLYEETFVALFADFLSGKNVNNMFADVKSEVDSTMKSIFNLATDEDFNSLYRGRVKTIFQTFSKDIGRVGNGLDFSRGTIFRQAANWIADQKGKGNIIERC